MSRAGEERPPVLAGAGRRTTLPAGGLKRGYGPGGGPRLAGFGVLVRGLGFLSLWLIGLGAATAAAAADGWRMSPKEVREEVKAVVADQLRAFQREDIPAAYAFAAASIRQQFRLPVYERMIRRGYAPLLKHARAEPGIVRDDGAAMAFLPVIVHDRDGKVVRYRYHLLREEGVWRVSGVLPEISAPKGET